MKPFGRASFKDIPIDGVLCEQLFNCLFACMLLSDSRLSCFSFGSPGRERSVQLSLRKVLYHFLLVNATDRCLDVLKLLPESFLRAVEGALLLAVAHGAVYSKDHRERVSDRLRFAERGLQARPGYSVATTRLENHIY